MSASINPTGQRSVAIKMDGNTRVTPRLTISPLPDILVDDTLPLERFTNYEYKKAEQIVEFARHTGSLVVYVVDYSISHPYNIEFCTLLFKQKDELPTG